MSAVGGYMSRKVLDRARALVREELDADLAVTRVDGREARERLRGRCEPRRGRFRSRGAGDSGAEARAIQEPISKLWTDHWRAVTHLASHAMMHVARVGPPQG